MPKYEIILLDGGTPDPRNPDLLLYYPAAGGTDKTEVFSTSSDNEATRRFDRELGLAPRAKEAGLPVFTTVGTAVVATRVVFDPFNDPRDPRRWALVKAYSGSHEDVGVKVFKDGDSWCALVGANLQDGIAGFGVTPSGALMDLMVKHGETLNEALGGENVEVPDEADD